MSSEESVIRFYGGPCRLDFDLSKGVFALFTRDRPLFQDSTGILLTRQGKKRQVLSTSGGWEVGREHTDGLWLFKPEAWGRLLFTVQARPEAVVLNLGAVWEEKPPAIEAVVPVRVPAGGLWPDRENVRGWRFYSNGFMCWSASGVVKARSPGDYLFPLFFPRRLKAMVANTSTPVYMERGRFTSDWFCALGDRRTGESVALGFIGIERALSHLQASFGGKAGRSSLEAVALFDGVKPESGFEFWGEPLAVIPGDFSGRNLETYAGIVAEKLGVSETRDVPPGWCSWYRYFTDVTSGDVEGNLEAACCEYPALGIDVIQIDDGYQKSVGDWLEHNEKFPRGTAGVAEKITARGKTAGIWLSPFTAARRSRVFKENPGWIIRTGRGRPVLGGINPAWKGRFYGLDPTNEEVIERLRRVFTAFKEQGFRFFKLDFMGCGVLEGNRCREGLTRAEGFRRALEVFRETVGDDAYIIAAGGPLLLTAGILDAQRVSGDVAPKWAYFWQRLVRDRSSPSVRNCLLGVLNRAFMSGRLFVGDPDCLLLRRSDSKLTPAERRTLASAIGVFGGSFMVSDDLSSWGDEETRTAARLLPPVPSKPRCPDLWADEGPSTLVSELRDPSGPYYLVWKVNWSGRDKTLRLEPGELDLDPVSYHAHEFWTGEYLGASKEGFSVRDVPGHGSVVVRLSPVRDGPAVLGTNLHVTQGAAEISALDSTAGRIGFTVSSLIECSAVVTISLPGKGPVTVSGGGPGGMSVRSLGGDVFSLEFELERTTRITAEREG